MVETRTTRSPALAFEFSARVQGLTNRDHCLDVIGRSLLRVFDGDSAGWNAMDLDTGVGEVRGYHREGEWDHDVLAAQLLSVADDHPMVRSYLDTSSTDDSSPRRLSDITTRGDLVRTRTYNELLRPLGAEHQLTILTTRFSPRCARAWAINRAGRDFAEEDRRLAAALQPMLALLDRTVGAVSPPVDEVAADARRRMGLSERELQVLEHIAAGRTAAAVARLLRISPRTVSKHLQNAYEKLGAHDRLLAVRRAEECGLIRHPDRTGPSKGC